MNTIPVPTPRLLSNSRKKSKQTKGPNLWDILDDVSKVFNIPISDIISKTKTSELVKCRRIYCYCCYILTDATTEKMCILINRERTNACHHVDMVRDLCQAKDEIFMENLNKYISESKIWKQYNKTA